MSHQGTAIQWFVGEIQFIYCNCCSYVWNLFLSYLSNAALPLGNFALLHNIWYPHNLNAVQATLRSTNWGKKMPAKPNLLMNQLALRFNYCNNVTQYISVDVFKNGKQNRKSDDISLKWSHSKKIISPLFHFILFHVSFSWNIIKPVIPRFTTMYFRIFFGRESEFVSYVAIIDARISHFSLSLFIYFVHGSVPMWCIELTRVTVCACRVCHLWMAQSSRSA